MNATQAINKCIEVLRTEPIDPGHLQDRELIQDFILRSIHRMEELKALVKKQDEARTWMNGYFD